MTDGRTTQNLRRGIKYAFQVPQILTTLLFVSTLQLLLPFEN